MAIASITAWLHNPKRDFHQGRMLYEQYGDDRLVLTIIRTGSGSYHFSKLQEAMEALNKLSNLQPKAIVIHDLAPIDKKPEVWDEAPDPILEIRNEKNRRYALARKRFETIRVMDSQEHRAEAALLLLDDMDFVNESWSAIDTWRETGVIKEVEKKEAKTSISDLSLKELMKQSKNIESYISKDKKKILSEKNPGKLLELKQRLELRVFKLAEMNRRIDELI